MTEQRELFPSEINAEGDYPNSLRMASNVELKFAADADDRGEKRPTFEITAYNGGAMRPSGFSRDVVVDLQGMSIGASLPIYRNHDPDRVVGHGKARVEGESQVSVSGVVSFDNEHAKEVVSSSKNDFPWQASIGANVSEYELVRDGESATVNGQKVEGPVLIARKSTLDEVSFVPLGADRSTSATIAAKSAPTKEKEMTAYQKWLEAKGFNESELTDSQSTSLKAMYETETNPPDPKTEPKSSVHASGWKETLESEKSERERVEAIGKLGADAIRAYPERLDDIERLVNAAQADKQVSPTDFELELLRANRPIGPSNIHTAKGGRDITAKVMEAALCQSVGVEDIDKKFDEQTLDAADRNFRSGLGLKQLLFRSAAANGQQFDSTNNLRGLLKAAFGEQPANRLQAFSGFSTFSLSGILSNVMNKMLLDHFNFVEQAWRPITSTRPVQDFKQTTSYSLTGDLKYEKLGPTGEIKHATLDEVPYPNRPDTYARMLAITRQDIINDDLGAFQRVPARLGRGSALAINEIFWTEFLDNATFFTAGQGNFDDGPDSALSVDGLTNADTLFMNLTDPDGNPMGTTPRILLVPPALKTTALQLMNSQQVRNPSATAAFGIDNPFAGAYDVVVSTYLSNSNITGNSAAAWYLLADPRDLPTIEMVFLNGRETPIVEQADVDFETLGIQVRGYHDFGVAKHEFRGGVKMAGA